MGEGALLRSFVEAVAQKLKRRRMLYYALKGAFFGLAASVIPLALKGLLGTWALPVVLALVVLGVLGGATIGLALPLTLKDAARVADRQLGLNDRVPTALGFLDRSDLGPVAEALVKDAATRTRDADLSAAVPSRWPLEGKVIPVPLFLALILYFAPAIPIPAGSLPSFSSENERGAEDKKEQSLNPEDRPARNQRPPVDKVEVVDRHQDPKQGVPGSRQQGDLSAVFKDTSLATQRPDFNSFMKRGDDRLRMLEQVDRLPDLRQDATRSPSRVVFQQMKSLFGGLRPDQISPDKLRELLNEMERLGRKEGDWGQDVGESMEALEGGQMDRAMSAMEKALQKMRAMEDRDRGRKELQGGKGDNRSGRGKERGGQGNESGEPDFGEEGSLPGQGKNPNPKGDPTARLKAKGYDTGVEGEGRPGRKEGFDTNLLGKGANVPSQLPYMSVFSQYRKMMEETMAREQIPFDYQNQIKDYFQSLEER